MRLTEQERYYQASKGLQKCERCLKGKKNWRGYSICEIPGMSPKRCGNRYQPDEKLIRLAAERMFK